MIDDEIEKLYQRNADLVLENRTLKIEIEKLNSKLSTIEIDLIEGLGDLKRIFEYHFSKIEDWEI